MELLTDTAPDTASPGVELEEGLDSNKQQQGEAGNQGRWPGTAQRGIRLLSARHCMKCVCSSELYCMWLSWCQGN